MIKEDKNTLINELTATLSEYSHFYVTDISGLNAGVTSELRRRCFNEDVKMVVVKNTIFKKALEATSGEYGDLYGSLKGNSSILFSNTGNLPAKLIKEFGKKNGKPVLKSAYVQECIYVGADQLDALVNVKSKEELIGDIVALLQSPAKNVISALQSGGNTIHGVLKTLGER